MTKTERAAHAAKWRKIALVFERTVRHTGEDRVGGNGMIYEGEVVKNGSWDMDAPNGLCGEWAENEEVVSLVFGRKAENDYLWPRTRGGDDCRVIAAGLIAAMFEAGDLD